MAEKIQLTPSELQAQAAEMKSLESEYESLFGNVSSELGKVNSNWSPNLAHNFSGKITSSNKTFKQITQELMNGAKVADTCAVTFETVDSQLAKLYCEDSDGNEAGTESIFRDIFNNDVEGLQDLFNFIDSKYDSIPEPERNLIKNFILKKIKYNDVAITDLYDILDDIVTGNVSHSTVENILSVSADVFEIESSFVKAVKTTIKIMPTYIKKTGKLDEKIDTYVSEGNLVAAIFTGVVSEGTTVLQGVADGLCKIIDKTLHLSDISDVIEIVTGGKIDIGGYLNKAGQNISDAMDYITNIDNYAKIGKSISDGITKGAKAVSDVAVGTFKNTVNFFKNLF